MFKRKITSDSNSNKKQKATALTQSSLSSWVKPQPQEQTRNINPEALFSKAGKESKELLSLEIKNMNSEWLKVLSEEMQKPYFIEVDKARFSETKYILCTNLTRLFFMQIFLA